MRLGSVTEVQSSQRNTVGFYDRWLNPEIIEADESVPAKLLKVIMLPITVPVFFFSGGIFSSQPWMISKDELPHPPM